MVKELYSLVQTDIFEGQEPGKGESAEWRKRRNWRKQLKSHCGQLKSIMQKYH